MNLKKILVCASAVLMLSGCGKALEIDPSASVSELKDKIEFTDQMTVLDKAATCKIYGIDEALAAECAALRGSGATAENLSIWKAADEKTADTLEEQLTAFLDSWIEGYSDYKPEEVPKLESAILEREGNYVVLCVSADNDAAESVIDALLQS